MSVEPYTDPVDRIAGGLHIEDGCPRAVAGCGRRRDGVVALPKTISHTTESAGEATVITMRICMSVRPHYAGLHSANGEGSGQLLPCDDANTARQH